MKGNKIVGIIIIIALILSVAVVGYSAINKTINKDKALIHIEQSMDESELNQSLLEETANGNLTSINLNINQQTGGTKIQFSDNTTEIYKVISESDKNFTTTVTKEQEYDHLDVNVDSNSSSNTIILSNKYNYNISGNIVAGGLTADFNNNSKVDDLSANITLGGLNIKFNGGTLNTSNIKITTGGLNIKGQPTGLTIINSHIDIGGINLQLSKPVADIFSYVQVGGVNPNNYQKISENEYKAKDFDSSENKLVLNSNITVGGINTQKFN